jgi:hypothetical protein
MKKLIMALSLIFATNSFSENLINNNGYKFYQNIKFPDLG